MNQRPGVKDATGQHIGVSGRPDSGTLLSGRTDQVEPTCAKRCAKRKAPPERGECGNGEAESRYKRALAIWEKALGPEHPDVATSLENYAGLLREVGRVVEADELAARAEQIRTRAGK